MREIKFRVWDKINKKWIKHFNIDLLNINIFSLPNIEINQYTGLKDKNGKEIYEGDIIIDKVGPKIKMVVKWDEEISGFRSFGQYNGENYIGYVGHFNKAGKNTCEVIGNIYENKELLRNENK